MDRQVFNAYRIMWLFVFFDLPTNTKKERRVAARFRKSLIEFGFTMMQYSVYIRHCASKENADMNQSRVITIIPSCGQVSLLQITDKQYEGILNFWGKDDPPPPEAPKQLEMF